MPNMAGATSVLGIDCNLTMFWEPDKDAGSASCTYHFSFWRTGTGAWKTILCWRFGFFFRKLELFHVQPVPCDPLVQALVDF